MALDGLGSIKVSLTGTGNLIQVSSVDLWVEKVFVEPHDDNVGNIYGGKSTMVVANKTWLFWLPPPTTNFVETWNAVGQYAKSFNLKDLYLAGDNGDGATVTYNLK